MGTLDLTDIASGNGVISQNTSNLRFEVAKTEADIRRDIAKAESDIRRDVAKDACDIIASISDQTNHLNLRFADMHNNIRDGKEEAMKANYESRLETNRLVKEQLVETIKGNDALKTHILEGKFDTFKELTGVKDAFRHELKEVREVQGKTLEAIEKCCCSTKRELLESRLLAAQNELTDARLTAVINSTVSAIQNGTKPPLPPVI